MSPLSITVPGPPQGKNPDLDSTAKAWFDALNGVVYRDDALIVRISPEKRYGPLPLVTVRPMEKPARITEGTTMLSAQFAT